MGGQRHARWKRRVARLGRAGMGSVARLGRGGDPVRERGASSRDFVSWEMMVVCDEESWRRRTPFYTRPLAEQLFLG